MGLTPAWRRERLPLGAGGKRTASHPSPYLDRVHCHRKRVRVANGLRSAGRGLRLSFSIRRLFGLRAPQPFMKLQRHNAVGSADDDFSVRTNRNVGYLASRSTRARGMPSIENIERVRSSPPAMMAGLPATVPIATARIHWSPVRKELSLPSPNLKT